MSAPLTLPTGVRHPLVVDLAAALVWSMAHALGFGSGAAYGLIAALVVPLDLRPVPPPLFVVLPVLCGLALGLGTLVKPLLQAPVVWAFAIVTLLAQLIAQLLLDKLVTLRTVLPILAILPLLGSNSTWLSAWHQWLAIGLGLAVGAALTAAFRLPSAGAHPEAEGHASQHGEKPALGGGPAEASKTKLPSPGRSPSQRLADPYFWRKVIASRWRWQWARGWER